MAENKTKETEANVDAFLNQIEDEQRRADGKAIAKLMQQATKFKPKMWGSSIVGFGSYHYKYESGREGDSCLVGFSPRKQNLVLYITGGFENYEALLRRLGKYKMGKACIYLNRLADIDPNVLKDLVKQSVEARKERHG